MTDRVYVSSSALHVLEFGLEPGGAFRHSATNKTVFAADVMYCVLEGELVLADPQHGEVRVVRAGDQVLFRRDTWHHGFNPSPEPLRVLEFFAPPPSMGTASQYARHQAMLEQVHYRDAALVRAVAGGPRRAPRHHPPRRRLRGRRALGFRRRVADPPGRPARGHRVPHRHDRPGLRRPRGGPAQGRGRVAPRRHRRRGCGSTCRSRTATATPPTACWPGDAMYVPAHSTMRVLSRSRRAGDLPHGVRPPGSLRAGLPSQIQRRVPEQARADQARLRTGHRRLHGGRVRAPEQAREQLGDQQRRPGCPRYRARRRAR